MHINNTKSTIANVFLITPVSRDNNICIIFFILDGFNVTAKVYSTERLLIRLVNIKKVKFQDPGPNFLIILVQL